MTGWHQERHQGVCVRGVRDGLRGLKKCVCEGRQRWLEMIEEVCV